MKNRGFIGLIRTIIMVVVGAIIIGNITLSTSNAANSFVFTLFLGSAHAASTDGILKIPESTKYIEEESFCGMSNIVHVVLPDTLLEI